MSRENYYPASGIEDNIGSAMRRHFYYYNIMDGNLFEAFDSFGGLRGKEVLVVGSNIPWYESNCVVRGAKTTTLEYLPRFYDHPSMSNVMVGEQLNKLLQAGKLFHTILCISSIEHDGLGRCGGPTPNFTTKLQYHITRFRYGDPINPTADLETMQRMKGMLVRGGLLYISFPVGRDAVVWTACRVYGKARIPLLFKGWTLLGAFGAQPGVYEQVANIHTQPVFVLRNDGVDNIVLP